MHIVDTVADSGDISPSNECIFELSLNDYTAVNSDDSEANPQTFLSTETITLDDSEQTNVLSDPDPLVIDLIDESDPEPQLIVSSPCDGGVVSTSEGEPVSSPESEPVSSHHTLLGSPNSRNQTLNMSTKH